MKIRKDRETGVWMSGMYTSCARTIADAVIETIGWPEHCSGRDSIVMKISPILEEMMDLAVVIGVDEATRNPIHVLDTRDDKPLPGQPGCDCWLEDFNEGDNDIIWVPSVFHGWVLDRDYPCGIVSTKDKGLVRFCDQDDVVFVDPATRKEPPESTVKA